MRISWLGIVSATLVLAVRPSWAAEPAAAPASHPARVALTKLVEQLPAGLEWAVQERGLFCVKRDSLKADGLPKTENLEVFRPLFAREFAQAGLQRPSGKVDLFATPSGPDTGVDFEIGGLIRDIRLKICDMAIDPNPPVYRISATVEIEWQVYSVQQKKVVDRFTTDGGASFKGARNNSAGVLLDAFADGAKRLAAREDFRAVLRQSPNASTSSDDRSGARIKLASIKPDGRPLGEATGAVVLIALPGGFGSGVLISDDGLILTNAHVVEKATTVAIRWSDGIETKGEVLKTHEKRDVALIRTDPRGRAPLPLRTGGVQVGETVVAIGSPLDPSMQGTVTRGIVSARRVFEGFSFIQSDVNVNHGNSGGPLLDDKGLVVGLTDIGFQPDGVPTGLNLFIPIKDALDFLAVDLAPAATSAPAQKTPVSQTGGSIPTR